MFVVDRYCQWLLLLLLLLLLRFVSSSLGPPTGLTPLAPRGASAYLSLSEPELLCVLSHIDLIGHGITPLRMLVFSVASMDAALWAVGLSVPNSDDCISQVSVPCVKGNRLVDLEPGPCSLT